MWTPCAHCVFACTLRYAICMGRERPRSIRLDRSVYLDLTRVFVLCCCPARFARASFPELRFETRNVRRFTTSKGVGTVTEYRPYVLGARGRSRLTHFISCRAVCAHTP